MIIENGLSDVHTTAQTVTGPMDTAAAKMGADALDVTVFSSLEEAGNDWQQLERASNSNPYQSFDWLKAWQDTLGASLQVEALVAVGRVNCTPMVLLPLGLQRLSGIRTLSFLGHQNGNQNTGLWDPSYYEKAAQDQIRAFLMEICRKSGADVISLTNIPETWNGRRHPLALTESTSSPSPIFTQVLPDDFDELFKRTHNKSARKNLLRKQRHLQSAEGYKVAKALTNAEIERGLLAFLDQRARRSEAAGIPNVFSNAPSREFLSRLLGLDPDNTDSKTCPMELWYLEAGGVIRSTYLCVEQSRTLYAYSNSVAHDEMLPNSPGLVLIKEIIDYACSSPTIETLDLGLGEERYKTAWTEPVPLVDCSLAHSWKGSLKMRVDNARTQVKAAIRNSKTLWPLVRKLRKWKAGLGSST
ncbi:GNAT family N-acetyltransferase [Roseibium sp. SCPC15]|uniref:GNAT family N-acetyltransferase n=1 Tax=Roseibium sp. SCP15 TaxID=3141376 RepID=UPI00333C1180